MADRVAFGIFHKVLGKPAGRVAPLLAVLQIVVILIALDGEFQIACIMLPATYLKKAAARDRAGKWREFDCDGH